MRKVNQPFMTPEYGEFGQTNSDGRVALRRVAGFGWRKGLRGPDLSKSGKNYV
jgi:hypothetical protein